LTNSANINTTTFKTAYTPTNTKATFFQPQSTVQLKTSYYCKRLQFTIRANQAFEKENINDSFFKGVNYIVPKFQIAYCPFLDYENTVDEYTKFQFSFNRVFKDFKYYYDEYEISLCNNLTTRRFPLFSVLLFQWAPKVENYWGQVLLSKQLFDHRSKNTLYKLYLQADTRIDFKFEDQNDRTQYSLTFHLEILPVKKIISYSVFTGPSILNKKLFYTVSFNVEKPFLSKLFRFAQKKHV
jgi:hypothetical protein